MYSSPYETERHLQTQSIRLKTKDILQAEEYTREALFNLDIDLENYAFSTWKKTYGGSADDFGYGEISNEVNLKLFQNLGRRNFTSERRADDFGCGETSHETN